MSKHTEREKSGQGLVEFALLLPLLLLLLVGVFEFGRVLFIYSNLFNATREGIRYGVTSPRDYNGIRDAVANRVSLAPVNPVENPFDPEGVWIIVQYDNGPGTPKHQNVDFLATGDRVFVNVRYNIKAMTPLFEPFFTVDGLALNSRATRTIQTIGVIVNPPPTAPPDYGGGGDDGGGDDGGGGGDGDESGPTITLAPVCGPAGAQSITINGQGWDGDDRVDVYFGATQVMNNTAINPTFTLSFSINNIQTGSYIVTVEGRQTGQTAMATYTVPCPVDPPTPTPTPTVAPTVTPTPTGIPDAPPPLALIEIDEPVPAGQTFVSGLAQPRETVTLRIIQTGLQVSVIVGDDGRFLFGNLPPLEAGMTLVVQGYGQQDTAIVGGTKSTPEPTPLPRGAYIAITPHCGPAGDQTITVNFYNWPNNYLTIHFDVTEVYNSSNKKVGGTFEHTFSVSNVAAGAHTVTAREWSHSSKDPNDLVSEYAVPFTSPCPVPDLVVSRLQLLTQPPLGTYQKIDVDVQVTNQGGGDIPSLFWVDLFADTPPDPYTYASVDYVAINGLPAGASINFTMWVDAGFATTGDHTLIALADTWNQVLESDETNNTSAPLTVTVTLVNPAPTPTPTPEVPPGPKGKISGITYMDGVPQSLANVYAYNSAGRLIWSGFSRTITTESGLIIDGYYEAELPAGDYTVVGQMRMANALYWGQVIVANLQPGETRQEVDINLTALE